MSGGSDPRTLPFRYEREDFIALAKLGRPRIVSWLFIVAWSLFAIAALLIAICLIAGSSRVVIFIPLLLAPGGIFAASPVRSPHQRLGNRSGGEA